VNVTATGGTAPFTGTGQFSELAGSYSYTVTDANGCSVIASVVVTQPTLLTGTAQLINPILCNGGVADINLFASGGTGPYNGTGPVSNLSAGTYSYNITDANGCAAIINTTINEPAALTLTSIVSNALCNGANDGSVDLTVAGGTSAYTFQWDNGSSNEDLANVVAGVYTVIVTDANGCVASTSATVNEPTALSLATSSTPASCNPDGSASVSVTGGTAPYAYTWSNGATAASITNVPAGNYTVTVTDNNNCSAIAFVSVSQLSGLTASATVFAPVLCNGGTATVNVTATGGTAPFTGTGQFSELAGSYSYTVTDANGCSAVASLTVNEPPLLTLSLTAADVTCNGLNDGIIQPNVSGGTPGYNYSWSNGSTNNSLSGLAPNNYTLTVTDQNGCTVNSSATISEPNALILSSIITNSLCNGDLNGAIDLTVTGGIVGYSYLWNNSSQSEDLTGITAGSYTVVVTDNNGCTASLVSNVNQPSTLNVSSSVTTPITVNGGTGIITVSATGGTPSYTNTGIYTVNAGTYSYTVTDANGCSSITTVTITEPNQLIANAIISTPILCNGGNATVNVTAVGGQGPYTGTGIFNLPAGTYNFTITDAFSVSATTSITITEPSALITTGQGTNITCFGQNNGVASISANGGVGPYSFLWNNGASNDSIINLAPGTYSVITTDANGCIANDTIIITQPNALIASSIISSSILCNGGNAVVSVTAAGGIAPYTGTGSFTVTAGTYSYSISDNNGCLNSTSITVTEPSLLSISTTSTNVTCNGAANGTASITASGGIAPYIYLWSNNATTSSITNLVPGLYTVLVTDANGCTVNASITITEPTILNASSVVSSSILCFGGNAVITISATGGTSPYTGVGNFNAPAGTQSYTVTDANGCIAQTNITVNQPGVLSGNSVVSQPILCFGGTGQVTVTAIGGTLPYVGTGIQTVLTGTYNYTVTDANGCTGLTSISISEPSQLAINIVGTNPLCNGNSNGSAQATVSGGTAPYAYLWSNGNTTSTATNLTSGTYTVQITDANGCVISGSVTLTQPGTLSANAIISSAILCNGGTGQVFVSANGGASPYSGIGQFSALAGNSTYTVTDINGCTASVSINVPQPSAVVVNSAIASPIACFGGNGNIIVTAAGGTPSYIGTGTFNVPAGTYTYPVTDANGCSTTTTITINQPSALIANAVIGNPILCNGGSASILVSANGGTPNYSGTGSFNALAGVQSYTVIDANGCASIASINVVQPTQLNCSISSQNVTCNGLNNGSAVVTANGGTPNYSYLWSNGATTASVSNLAPGAYSVTVTDANGCQSVSNVNITQPTVLTSAVVQTANILCFGGTGSVFVSANGGSAPYVGTGSQSVVAGNQSFTVTDANGCTSASSILITQPTQLIAAATQTTPILCFGGQATVALTGTGGTGTYTGTGSFLSVAGNITYTIQDANGCSASTSILIAQPTAVTAAFNNTSVTCFGLSNGSSVASVTGGTPGYTYLWNTGSTTNSINNQLAGNYVLQVTDANGCIFNLNTTITQPAPIVATANVILPIACFGGQAIVLVNGAGGTPGYSGNGTFNEFAGTHTYVLIDQNGCIDSTTITVTQPAAFTAVASITSPIACSGGQATVVVSANGGVAPFSGTGTFTVSAGTYTYTLIDANGCVATTTINVTQPTPLVLSATIVNPILCHGDSALISIGASGGTPAYSGIGNYLVPAGNYTYIVSDLNGCNSTIGIQVTQPTLLTSSVASTNISCNGANDGSAIVFYSGGTAPLSPLWSTGATSNSINNLAPGNYSVTITDANGCQNVHNLTITQPNVLLASAIQTVPIACFNGNATVVVSATGGTNPYTGTGTFFPTAGVYNYVVSDAQGCSDTATITILQPTALTATATIVNPIVCFGGQATVNISASGGIAPYVGTGNINVSAGNQSFTVTDANGCSFAVNLFINQPTQLLTSISSQNVSCFNAGNGSATVTPIGGTPGYQYLWSNTDTTASTSNLVPGLYSVVVTDTNGCQSTNQVTITQPSQLTASSSISSPVFCFGGNATINITAAGGTQPYTGIGSFLQIAGTQTYYVTDANGCVDSTTITVNQPNQLIAFANQTTNVLCFGGTATVAISSTGGTPSFTGTGNFTVSAGWNNFTVTDSYGCQDTTSIFINQPTLLVANATLVSPVLCNGGTAAINISASGGTPGYIGQGNFTVIAGTYTYNISDANGCTASTTITITQPNTLQAVANITSPIVCNAGTGVITITGIGGTAPYTGTGSFTVPAGTYTYPITDANGCTSSVTITINQPPVLTVSLTQINVNCNGFATGSITANPAGGQGPYTYLWSNNQVSQTVSNLLAGSYNVVVTDNLGCTVSASATITQPQAPILLQESHVNVLCFGNNTGSINLSVSGGTSPYTYSWSNSATSQDIQNLIAGIYNVTVTDANGCIAVMSINITQPAFPLTVGYTVSNVSCFGYTDGAIDVTPQGGTGPFTYFWTTGQFTQDLNNIPPGQYIIAITDANNCVSSAQITVTQPLAPLSANITQVPVSCYGYNDGQLTANTLGGTAPYSYVWTPTGQTGSIASALAPGNYIVNITDANGCTASATDVLTTPPPFIASFTVSDNIVCLPSTVTFTNSSIGNFSTALWTFSNGLTYSSNQFNVDFNNIGCVDVTLLITNTNGCTADTTISNAVCVVPGPTAAFTTASPEIDFVSGGIDFINNSQNYTGSLWQFGDGGTSTQDNPSYFYPASTIADYNVMLVVYDINGCTDTAYNVVQSNDVVRLTVPNAFTPNGDGLNDVFTPIISNSDQVKYYRFEVYNRWGQLIFESNKPGEGWDGKYKGKLSQFGAYNWKVSYDVPDQDSINANGHVTLVK
jgi:gliding motility-associated-like protein